MNKHIEGTSIGEYPTIFAYHSAVRTMSHTRQMEEAAGLARIAYGIVRDKPGIDEEALKAAIREQTGIRLFDELDRVVEHAKYFGWIQKGAYPPSPASPYYIDYRGRREVDGVSFEALGYDTKDGIPLTTPTKITYLPFINPGTYPNPFLVEVTCPHCGETHKHATDDPEQGIGLTGIGCGRDAKKYIITEPSPSTIMIGF